MIGFRNEFIRWGGESFMEVLTNDVEIRDCASFSSPTGCDNHCPDCGCDHACHCDDFCQLLS